jgi:hypothetical protein
MFPFAVDSIPAPRMGLRHSPYGFSEEILFTVVSPDEPDNLYDADGKTCKSSKKAHFVDLYV